MFLARSGLGELFNMTDDVIKLEVILGALRTNCFEDLT